MSSIYKNIGDKIRTYYHSLPARFATIRSNVNSDVQKAKSEIVSDATNKQKNGAIFYHAIPAVGAITVGTIVNALFDSETANQTNRVIVKLSAFGSGATIAALLYGLQNISGLDYFKKQYGAFLKENKKETASKSE